MNASAQLANEVATDFVEREKFNNNPAQPQQRSASYHSNNGYAVSEQQQEQQ